MGKAFVSFRAGRKRPWRVRWRERVGSKLQPREKGFDCGLKAGGFAVAHEDEDELHEELAMSQTDRARWWRIKEDCAAAAVDPEAAIAAGLKALHSQAPKSEVISTARDFWRVDALERKLRKPTIENVCFAVKAFMSGREMRLVSSFTADELVAWVAAHYSKQASRDTMLRRLVTFFRWCAARPRFWCEPKRFGELGWPHQVIEDGKAIGFYTAGEMRAYLEAVPAKLKCAVATGFLLGVRPFELCRIRLTVEISGEKYGIDETKWTWRLPGEWTKTRKYRKLYALPDAWIFWWLAFKREIRVRDRRGKKFEGRLVPMNYKNFLRALKTARRAIGLRAISDGFRHSFATHGYHRSADGAARGVEWCLALAGHTGRLTTFAAHYDGKVDSIEAEDYYLSYPTGAACVVKTRARIISVSTDCCR